MKILWLTNIPSPYRVDFFNRLSQHCDLTVLFECAASRERDSSWQNFHADFHAVFLRGIQYRTDMACCPQVLRHLRGDYDQIVVTDYASLTGMLAIAYLQLRHRPFILEGDGAFPGTGKGWRERLKRLLISSASHWFATSQPHEDFYAFYGADPKRIVRYPFTSVAEDDIDKAPTPPVVKRQLRDQLHLQGQQILLTVGQIIPRKGIDLLLQAACALPPQVSIYIIGGQVTPDYADFIRSHQLKQVHFLDFVPHGQLADYYRAADLLVLPTREDIWGLVVNEALAKGLPVITTDRCLAGVAMLTPGCGKIVPTENVEQLRSAICQALSSPTWLEQAAIAALQISHDYTLEKMVAAHLEFFKGPPRPC